MDCAPVPLKVIVPVLGVIVPADPRLPFILSVPIPEKTSLLSVPDKVIFPLTVAVPVDIVISETLLVVVPFIERLPADRVPAPTARVEVPLLVGSFSVIEPETVRLLLPEIVMPVVAPELFIVTDAHTAATSTVTVWPLAIITASVDAGTPEGLQVAAALQLPLLVLVFVCPHATLTKNKPATTKSVANKEDLGNRFFIKKFFKVEGPQSTVDGP